MYLLKMSAQYQQPQQNWGIIFFGGGGGGVEVAFLVILGCVVSAL